MSINELTEACEAGGIPLYGTDFLCRTLAVLYCYGGGPGGEYFRAPLGMAVLGKARSMLEQAVLEKDRAIVELFRQYVRELRQDNAPWLPQTLDKLNIPRAAVKYSECVRPGKPEDAA